MSGEQTRARREPGSEAPGRDSRAADRPAPSVAREPPSMTDACNRAVVRGIQVLWAEPMAQDLANAARRAEIAALFQAEAKHICQ